MQSSCDTLQETRCFWLQSEGKVGEYPTLRLRKVRNVLIPFDDDIQVHWHILLELGDKWGVSGCTCTSTSNGGVSR